MTAHRLVVATISICLVMPLAAQAQGRGNGTPNPLRLLTRTIYTEKTELFAAYRPYVVGQESRFTAHLTRITDRFEAYPTSAKVVISFTVGGMTVEKTSTPDRSGVFPIAITATVVGMGTATVIVTTAEGTERFVVDNIPVEPDLQTAIAHQPPAPVESAPIRYSKEDGWDGRFATAPIRRMALAEGKTGVLAAPRAAIVQEQGQPHVYVQRNPEAFELRAIKTGDSSATYVAVTDGLREGERIVTIGADKLPRK
jgi:hypothetical protein